MSDEAALSLWAVWTAGSPALVAFSGDRAADLFSALVVLGALPTEGYPEIYRVVRCDVVTHHVRVCYEPFLLKSIVAEISVITQNPGQ